MRGTTKPALVMLVTTKPHGLTNQAIAEICLNPAPQIHTINSGHNQWIQGDTFGADSGMTRSALWMLDDQDFIIAVLFKDIGGGENTVVIVDLDAPPLDALFTLGIFFWVP